jgi:hypothetical protein
MSLREVPEGHPPGEGDMNGIRLFSEAEQLPITVLSNVLEYDIIAPLKI